MEIRVADIDERCTRFIGDIGDRTSERGVFDDSVDEQVLACREVRAHANGELRVATEAFFRAELHGG